MYHYFNASDAIRLIFPEGPAFFLPVGTKVSLTQAGYRTAKKHS
jgi:hypothetical protein